MDAIRVDGLVKTFDGFTAVDGVSFAVAEGELFGLLGPNGAGKTTTINMLSTLLRPTAGGATVAGFDVVRDRDAVRRSIGIVFQEPALDGRLTGLENLEFHTMMYGLAKAERRSRIDEVLALVELTDKASTLVDKYSGGMKRRLEIARGLTHRPKVLFLDEPTLGLDAQTRRHIWDYVHKLNREAGVTIILTTHYMEEADFLCARVAIMDHGAFAAIDAPDRLKDLLGGDVVSLELEGDAAAFVDRLAGVDWVKRSKRHDGTLSLTMERGERRIPELVMLAQQSGAAVICVNLRKPSLEDVFLHFTGRTIREQEASQSERNRAMIMRHGLRRR
ncbi:MAG TPA: ATP-binding cassette domain-containing protein [Candidatus Aminicenantes bacterium]|nr:ATP-binding cassette domain-containing protein [Candidatus Aminicenantes bacterium]